MSHKHRVESNRLAALSVVASTELVQNTRDHSKLLKMQEEVNKSTDGALAVKDLLTKTKPQEVNAVIGKLVDDKIRHLGVRSVEVTGVEDINRSINAEQYLKAHIQGCEGFLADIGKMTRITMSTVANAVHDKLVLIKEGKESLNKRLSLLEETLKTDKPKVDTSTPITISVNQFKHVSLNGSVPTDPAQAITRTSNIVKSITGNFYRANQGRINEMVSFFSRFEGMNEEQALAHILQMPKSLSRLNFKDASLRYDSPNPLFVSKRTNTLLGDSFFVNTELKEIKAAKSLDELTVMVDLMHQHSMVSFVTTKVSSTEESLTIKPWDEAKVKQLLIESRKALNDNEQNFIEGDSYSLNSKDYAEVLRSIDNTELPNSLQQTILRLFNNTMLKLTREELNLRTAVVNYLILLINAMINVSERSLGLE